MATAQAARQIRQGGAPASRSHAESSSGPRVRPAACASAAGPGGAGQAAPAALCGYHQKNYGAVVADPGGAAAWRAPPAARRFPPPGTARAALCENYLPTGDHNGRHCRPAWMYLCTGPGKHLCPARFAPGRAFSAGATRAVLQRDSPSLEVRGSRAGHPPEARQSSSRRRATAAAPRPAAARREASGRRASCRRGALAG